MSGQEVFAQRHSNYNNKNTMSYNSSTSGGLAVGEQISTPKLRPKPSSNILRSTFAPRPSITSISSPTSPPQQFNRSSISRSASIGATDPSIYTRKERERRPSALPKPLMERSITPTPRPRTGPPTKEHRAFTMKKSDISSTGSEPEKVALPSERKFRRVIRKTSSNMSNEKVYTLGGLRTGSTTSFNASTNSLSTTGSSLPGGSRSASQGSILGITMPATSTSSQSSLSSSMHMRKRSSSDSSRVPRLMTQDLQFSGNPYDSSPSTRYTDSPFSQISTPTSTSSQSPGPAAMMRGLSASPGRAPVVTRQRKSSIASIEITLDPVRESTTSTSSDSTVRAGEKGKSEPQNSRPFSPPAPQPTTASAQTTPPHGSVKSPKLAPSPRLLSKPASPSPVNPVVALRRMSSVSGILPRPTTNREPTGLGVSMPTSSGLQVLPRTRSRSAGSSFSQPKQRKEAATPPLPSPGFATSRPAMYRAPSKESPMYNTVPQPSKAMNKMTKPPPARSDSHERSFSPTKSSPPKQAPTTSSRLAFLSRGRKNSEEKPEKLVRRGPTAGTGYEGYGAFAKTYRGRSGSSSGRSRSDSQSSIPRSSSGSRPSSVDLEPQDEYLRERLKPVVILGGTVVDNQNVRPAEMARTASSPGSVETTRSGSDGLSVRSASSLGGMFRREPSPASSEKETVAHRRAHITKRAVTPIPTPIDTTVGRRPQPSPSPVSSLATTSSRKQSFDNQNDLATPVTATKSKRWNFFQRSTKPATPAVAAASPRQRQYATAHYAILDAEEQRQAEYLAEQLRQHHNNHHASMEVQVNYTHNLRNQQSIHFNEDTKSPKAPSPLSAGSASERVRGQVRKAKADARTMLQQKNPGPAQQRPNLPLVQTKILAPPPSLLNTAVEYTTTADSLEPPTITTTAATEFQVPWGSFGLTPTEARPGDQPEIVKDFVEYDPLDISGRRPSNKNMPSPVAPTPVTAPVGKFEWPRPAPAVPVVQVEEEIWPEYNELERLYGMPGEETIQPPTAPALGVGRSNTVRSTTSSLGAPFQYSDMCANNDEDLIDLEEPVMGQGVYVIDSPTIRPLKVTKAAPLNIPILNITKPPNFFGPSDQLPCTPPAQRVMTPATPWSISSFIRGYGERDMESRVESVIIETLNIAQNTTTSTATNIAETTAETTSQAHRSTDSTGSILSSASSGSIPANLQIDEMRVRPWALLASRWLSFDRVLLSPAHSLLSPRPTSSDSPSRVPYSPATSGRILVIDGLGTDDWSFYCALTYPSAKVYNLTPTPPTSSTSVPASPSVPRPQNHKQVHHPNYTSMFPFPKGFFDVVSFRFLPSASERHWGWLVSECKRVLKPGGWLETTVLDAEMLNTGKRAERAVGLVRGIRERENGGRVGAKAGSEKVLRILQKKGFAEISKCFVGLPAVGKIEAETEASTGEVPREREPSPDDPDAINEVVSKVGRWWYTRCYERVITEGGEAPARSMWNNKALLKECARKRTNFKMLVCHARKPTKATTAV